MTNKFTSGKKITIVTPSFNQGKFIERTIRSIWDQEGDFSIEHIIADGGSTDETIDIIKRYEGLLNVGEYPIRCRGLELIWWSEKDRGQSDAINRGLRKASGDFMAWQNSDDTFNPGSFQEMVDAFLKNPKIDLVFGNFYFIDEDDKTLQKVYHRPFSKWEFLYVCPNITNQSSFWKKELLKKTGLLDENYHYGMDFEFFVRLSEHGEFKYVDSFWGNLRIHQDSKTVSTGEDEKWGREYAKIRIKYGIETDSKKKWKDQYRMRRAYFFGRRFFWYLLNGQTRYLWEKLVNDPGVQFWKDKTPKKNENKPKIAILHPAFSLGGAGAVAIFTLEALKEDFELSFVTTDVIDLKEINDFFGTYLKDDDFENIVVPKNKIIRKIIKPAFLLKVAFVQRYIKRNAGKFELLFSTRCEMDLSPKSGVQYVHFPVIKDEALREIGQMQKGLFYDENIFRKIYYFLFLKISLLDLERIKDNISLVNSKWTGEIVRRVYGISNYQVVYPPVFSDFPFVEWGRREDGFVCIGAVSPAKRIIEIIEILKKVRKFKNNLHLHIIGKDVDSEYAKKIETEISRNGEWISWERDLDRKKMTDLVARHKYGIHGMENEHFGIAVAELVNAGCIPFVPKSGGQIEVVEDGRLTYSDIENAVEKIKNVLENEDIQSEIRIKLDNGWFSNKTFKVDILRIVNKSMKIR